MGPEYKISQMPALGYNAVSVAFARIEGSNVRFHDDTLTPFGKNPEPTMIKNDIALARNNRMQHILISVGGGNNTFLPAGAAPAAIAKSLIDFCKKYGFNGVDFDLEISVDGNYLANIISEIKKQDPSMIVSIAPQVNEIGQGIDYITTEHRTDYQEALASGNIDFAFIQLYNNPWPKIKLSDGALCSTSPLTQEIASANLLPKL